MITREELVSEIKKKKSVLCVGLDPDIDKLPKHLLKLEDPFYAFCKEIIDFTHEHAVAFKPNLAFFEALGSKGWESFFKVCAYLKAHYPKHFLIADAKRGDIGNTSKKYANAFFESAKCDSITVAPYMGKDSVVPFLEDGKGWVILLALTSNPGAFDFQTMQVGEVPLYIEVLKKSSQWGTAENLMYVVGATKAEFLAEIREVIPDHFLLVPGVGAQGGSMSEVFKYGKGEDVGLLINASRSILYAASGVDYATASKKVAETLHQEMKAFI